jgi:hypothetical protein
MEMGIESRLLGRDCWGGSVMRWARFKFISVGGMEVRRSMCVEVAMRRVLKPPRLVSVVNFFENGPSFSLASSKTTWHVCTNHSNMFAPTV